MRKEATTSKQSKAKQGQHPQQSTIMIGAVTRSSAATAQANKNTGIPASGDVANPYQNQNMQTPYKIKQGKKQ